MVDGSVRVPLHMIRVRPNVTAGMNLLVVAVLVQLMRCSTDDPDPALVVPDGDGWRVTDGRHRYVAALMAGRPDLLCVVDVRDVVRTVGR